MSAFLTSTPRGSLEALAYQGILTTDCYVQIQSALAQRLSPQHALLFAEPVHDETRQVVDWYTEAPGSIRPLLSLPPEEQEQARGRIQALALDIQREVELALAMDSQSAARGNLLALAMKYPGSEHIYIVGNQPVLTCWGFAPGTQGAQPEELVRLGLAAPSAPVPVTIPATSAAEALPMAERSPRRLRWLWGLLKLLLLLLFLYLLALLLFGPSGCAKTFFISPPVMGGCARTPGAPTVSPDLKNELDKEARLQAELDALRAKLLERSAQCVPPKSEVTPEEPPTLDALVPKTEDPPPQPKPEPKPVPKPEPKPVPTPEPIPEPKRAPPKDDKLHIPENASKDNDYKFLEGCWIAETGLFNRRTHKPIVVEYCFDAHGQGTRRVTEQDGSHCSGSVEARFHGDQLYMEADSAACQRGAGYVPNRVDCRDAGGAEAECYGQELGGDRNKWRARFHRK